MELVKSDGKAVDLYEAARQKREAREAWRERRVQSDDLLHQILQDAVTECEGGNYLEACSMVMEAGCQYRETLVKLAAEFPE